MSSRFDDVHPATKLWWEQRDQCEQCQNCVKAEGLRGECIMHCVNDSGASYCIDARLEGQPCGPDARLFIKREP